MCRANWFPFLSTTKSSRSFFSTADEIVFGPNLKLFHTNISFKANLGSALFSCPLYQRLIHLLSLVSALKVKLTATRFQNGQSDLRFLSTVSIRAMATICNGSHHSTQLRMLNSKFSRRFRRSDRSTQPTLGRI